MGNTRTRWIRLASLLACSLLLTQCDGDDMTIAVTIPAEPPQHIVPSGPRPNESSQDTFSGTEISRVSADGTMALGALTNLPDGISPDDVQIRTMTTAPQVDGVPESALTYAIGPTGVRLEAPLPLLLDASKLPSDISPDQAVVAILVTETVEQVVLDADGKPVMEDVTDEQGNVVTETVTLPDGSTTEQNKQQPKTETVTQEKIVDLVVEYDATTGVLKTELPQLGTVVVMAPNTTPPTYTDDQCGPKPLAAEATLGVADIRTTVQLPKNYPGQLHDLYYAYFNSGSKMARGRLCAQFCADATCANPLGIVPATVQGADSKGYYMYSSGWPKPVSVKQMVRGATHLRFMLIPQYNADLQQPANGPVIFQTEATSVTVNHDGRADHNPAPSSIAIVDGESTQTLPTLTVGSIDFTAARISAQLDTRPAADTGRLAVAVSEGNYRNRIELVDLANHTRSADSYVIQRHDAPFAGDLCGFIRGDTTLYAIGVDATGAHIFALDPKTGAQLHGNTTDIHHPDHDATSPNKQLSPDNMPWPCRGAFVAKGGKKHLYLLQWKGAGALPTSNPEPLYVADVTTFTAEAPGTASLPLHNKGYNDMALRTIAVDASKNRLFLGEMSWSKNNETNGMTNKILTFHLDSNGALDLSQLAVTTDTNTSASETCGGTNPYPAGMTIAIHNKKELLFFGHNTGLAAYQIQKTFESTPIPQDNPLAWIARVTLDKAPWTSTEQGKIAQAKVTILPLILKQRPDILTKPEMSALGHAITKFDEFLFDAIRGVKIPLSASDADKIAHAGVTTIIRLRKNATTTTTTTYQLVAQGTIDLTRYGQVFTDLHVSPDKATLYAMPMCKSAVSDRWSLPYAKGTELADQNWIAALDLQGTDAVPAPADRNSDGQADYVDADYYFLKQHIRALGSTLPIPPVVYTGPQMAITPKSIVVRGSGIQGNGSLSISSSGMGQVQDVGFFDRTTSRGIIFQDYNPFFNGLSSEAGKGFGKWGYELGPSNAESSTGGLIYLPGN